MRKMTLLIMGFMITFSMVVNAEDITGANVTSKVDSKTTEKMTNKQKILALLAKKKKTKAENEAATLAIAAH